MPHKLRMVLSLDEFKEDMIQLSVTHNGAEYDEIIGIAPWQDKIIIATRYKILVLDRDQEMEVKLQEAMNYNEQVSYALGMREEQLVRDHTRRLKTHMASLCGMHPNQLTNDATIEHFVREIRKP